MVYLYLVPSREELRLTAGLAGLVHVLYIRR